MSGGSPPLADPSPVAPVMLCHTADGRYGDANNEMDVDVPAQRPPPLNNPDLQGLSAGMAAILRGEVPSAAAMTAAMTPAEVKIERAEVMPYSFSCPPQSQPWFSTPLELAQASASHISHRPAEIPKQTTPQKQHQHQHDNAAPVALPSAHAQGLQRPRPPQQQQPEQQQQEHPERQPPSTQLRLQPSHQSRQQSARLQKHHYQLQQQQQRRLQGHHSFRMASQPSQRQYPCLPGAPVAPLSRADSGAGGHCSGSASASSSGHINSTAAGAGVGGVPGAGVGGSACRADMERGAGPLTSGAFFESEAVSGAAALQRQNSVSDYGGTGGSVGGGRVGNGGMVFSGGQGRGSLQAMTAHHGGQPQPFQQPQPQPQPQPQSQHSQHAQPTEAPFRMSYGLPPAGSPPFPPSPSASLSSSLPPAQQRPRESLHYIHHYHSQHHHSATLMAPQPPSPSPPHTHHSVTSQHQHQQLQQQQQQPPFRQLDSPSPPVHLPPRTTGIGGDGGAGKGAVHPSPLMLMPNGSPLLTGLSPMGSGVLPPVLPPILPPPQGAPLPPHKPPPIPPEVHQEMCERFMRGLSALMDRSARRAPTLTVGGMTLALDLKTRRGPIGTSSKYRGVTRHRRTKRWEAHIWEERRQVYLGGFEVEEHAAKAHDVMAIRCRGTDTVLNYVADTYSELLPLLLPCNGRRPLHRNEVVRLLRSHGKEATRQTHAAGRPPGRSLVAEAPPEPPVTIFGDDECDLYGVMPGSSKSVGSAGGGGPSSGGGAGTGALSPSSPTGWPPPFGSGVGGGAAPWHTPWSPSGGVVLPSLPQLPPPPTPHYASTHVFSSGGSGSGGLDGRPMSPSAASAVAPDSLPPPPSMYGMPSDGGGALWGGAGGSVLPCMDTMDYLTAEDSDLLDLQYKQTIRDMLRLQQQQSLPGYNSGPTSATAPAAAAVGSGGGESPAGDAAASAGDGKAFQYRTSSCDHPTGGDGGGGGPLAAASQPPPYRPYDSSPYGGDDYGVCGFAPSQAHRPDVFLGDDPRSNPDSTAVAAMSAERVEVVGAPTAPEAVTTSYDVLGREGVAAGNRPTASGLGGSSRAAPRCSPAAPSAMPHACRSGLSGLAASGFPPTRTASASLTNSYITVLHSHLLAPPLGPAATQHPHHPNLPSTPMSHASQSRSYQPHQSQQPYEQRFPHEHPPCLTQPPQLPNGNHHSGESGRGGKDTPMYDDNANPMLYHSGAEMAVTTAPLQNDRSSHAMADLNNEEGLVPERGTPVAAVRASGSGGGGGASGGLYSCYSAPAAVLGTCAALAARDGRTSTCAGTVLGCLSGSRSMDPSTGGGSGDSAGGKDMEDHGAAATPYDPYVAGGAATAAAYGVVDGSDGMPRQASSSSCHREGAATAVTAVGEAGGGGVGLGGMGEWENSDPTLAGAAAGIRTEDGVPLRPQQQQQALLSAWPQSSSVRCGAAPPPSWAPALLAVAVPWRSLSDVTHQYDRQARQPKEFDAQGITVGTGEAVAAAASGVVDAVGRVTMTAARGREEVDGCVGGGYGEGDPTAPVAARSGDDAGVGCADGSVQGEAAAAATMAQVRRTPAGSEWGAMDMSGVTGGTTATGKAILPGAPAAAAVGGSAVLGLHGLAAIQRMASSSSGDGGAAGAVDVAVPSLDVGMLPVPSAESVAAAEAWLAQQEAIMQQLDKFARGADLAASGAAAASLSYGMGDGGMLLPYDGPQGGWEGEALQAGYTDASRVSLATLPRRPGEHASGGILPFSLLPLPYGPRPTSPADACYYKDGFGNGQRRLEEDGPGRSGEDACNGMRISQDQRQTGQQEQREQHLAIQSPADAPNQAPTASGISPGIGVDGSAGGGGGGCRVILEWTPPPSSGGAWHTGKVTAAANPTAVDTVIAGTLCPTAASSTRVRPREDIRSGMADAGHNNNVADDDRVGAGVGRCDRCGDGCNLRCPDPCSLYGKPDGGDGEGDTHWDANGEYEGPRRKRQALELSPLHSPSSPPVQKHAAVAMEAAAQPQPRPPLPTSPPVHYGDVRKLRASSDGSTHSTAGRATPPSAAADSPVLVVTAVQDVPMICGGNGASGVGSGGGEGSSVGGMVMGTITTGPTASTHVGGYPRPPGTLCFTTELSAPASRLDG